jgi:hypothetical protein
MTGMRATYIKPDKSSRTLEVMMVPKEKIVPKECGVWLPRNGLNQFMHEHVAAQHGDSVMVRCASDGVPHSSLGHLLWHKHGTAQHGDSDKVCSLAPAKDRHQPRACGVVASTIRCRGGSTFQGRAVCLDQATLCGNTLA